MIRIKRLLKTPKIVCLILFFHFFIFSLCIKHVNIQYISGKMASLFCKPVRFKCNLHRYETTIFMKHYENYVHIIDRNIFSSKKSKIFSGKTFIFFLIFASKHRLWVRVRTASAKNFVIFSYFYSKIDCGHTLEPPRQKTLKTSYNSEPEFYGDLVYQFMILIGRNDFSFQFRKIITRYRRKGYINLNVMR